MNNKKIEELKKNAIKFKVNQKDIDKYNKKIELQEIERLEKEKKVKTEYIKSIFNYFVFQEEIFGDAEKENKRTDELMKLFQEGSLTFKKYFDSLRLEDNDINYSISTYLFDNSESTFNNLLLEVLKENFSIECYIEILENMYLGHHDT